jgi:nicotinic acid phosphoribosyltransferase
MLTTTMMNDNLILSTDSYKASHFMQYPPEVDGMFSYLESRGGKYEDYPHGMRWYVHQFLGYPR